VERKARFNNLNHICAYPKKWERKNPRALLIRRARSNPRGTAFAGLELLEREDLLAMVKRIVNGGSLSRSRAKTCRRW
jgi:hypothetical protein